MKTILIDGPYDGKVVDLGKPAIEALVVMQLEHDPGISSSHHYMPWNDKFAIYEGKFGNVERITVEMMVPYTGNGRVADFDEAMFFEEAEKCLRENAKNMEKAKLLSYQIKKTREFCYVSGTVKVKGIFNYYIYPILPAQ